MSVILDFGEKSSDQIVSFVHILEASSFQFSYVDFDCIGMEIKCRLVMLWDQI